MYKIKKYQVININRIRKTKRSCLKWESISIVTPREIPHLRLIEQVTKSKMKRIVPPTNKEAERGKQQAAVEKIVRMIDKGELDAYKDTATEMLDEHDSVSIVSAALKLLMKERKNIPV